MLLTRSAKQNKKIDTQKLRRKRTKKKQAPEAGGCTTGDGGHRGHRGKGDTELTESTVLRH